MKNKITYRKLSTGNWVGRCGFYYIFLRKRVHGKFDGHERHVTWWSAYIGRNGEYLFAEGNFGSYLNTLAKAKLWVRGKMKFILSQ